jgi:hypothetical protein
MRFLAEKFTLKFGANERPPPIKGGRKILKFMEAVNPSLDLH